MHTRLSHAGDTDVEFELAGKLEYEGFPESDWHAPADSNANVRMSDPAVTPVAFSRQPSDLGGARLRSDVGVGYDGGFVIASQRLDSDASKAAFLLRMNGWGQLRHANFNSQGPNLNVNQFQLKRARLAFSGHAFTPDFSYFVQLDGRSSSGDSVRLLDYFMTYDVGHHTLGFETNALEFKAGRYKMPFTMARYLSGREFEFTDRSMASTFFDVNRSLAWGLHGARTTGSVPLDWEVAVFNGLVTGGAETGSSGALDNNFAYSGRIFIYPIGEWGEGQLADFQWHERLATRAGIAFANSTIESSGSTEFAGIRVVDSGATLESLLSSLPAPVNEYSVSLYSVDASCKWRGWSMTLEYYLRQVDDFDNSALPDLFDHGMWLQLGKFVVPRKLQLLTRWSRVVGDSGTLGLASRSSEEVAAGVAWYFRDQHAKANFDVTYLNGAPISSSALDIAPGDVGWLFRTQVQFAF